MSNETINYNATIVELNNLENGNEITNESTLNLKDLLINARKNYVKETLRKINDQIIKAIENYESNFIVNVPESMRTLVTHYLVEHNILAIKNKPNVFLLDNVLLAGKETMNYIANSISSNEDAKNLKDSNIYSNVSTETLTLEQRINIARNKCLEKIFNDIKTSIESSLKSYKSIARIQIPKSFQKNIRVYLSSIGIDIDNEYIDNDIYTLLYVNIENIWNSKISDINCDCLRNRFLNLAQKKIIELEAKLPALITSNCIDAIYKGNLCATINTGFVSKHTENFINRYFEKEGITDYSIFSTCINIDLPKK